MQARSYVCVTDYVEDLSKGMTQFQCQKCLEDFVCEEDLSVHWGEVHGPKLYPCNICGLRFILPSVLERHEVVMHNKDTKMGILYRCNLCALQFINEKWLGRHHELVHPKDYHCKHCGKVFNLKRRLYHHIQEKHVIRYDLGEEQFATKTSPTKQLEDHGDNQDSSVKAFDIQHDERSGHVCNKCAKVKQNIRNHNSKMIDVCEVCTVCGLREHSTTCRGSCIQSDEDTSRSSENNQYKCQFFEEVCESKELLNKHNSFNVKLAVHKKIRTDEKRNVCTVCGMRFKLKRQLNVHMRTHNSDVSYVCIICHKPFRTIQDLMKHSSTCREPCSESGEITFKSKEGLIRDKQDDSQYNCPLCLQDLSEKMLRAHFVRHHRSHICNKCGKVLISLDALKIHMNIHTEVQMAVPRTSDERDKGKHEDNRYNCQFCMEVYESKKLLKTHISQSHRTTHVCSKCGKVLESLATLDSHMKTHTGGNSDRQDEEKLAYSQFACQFCMEVCESKKLLKTHISQSHRTTHVCYKCGKILDSLATLSSHMKTHAGGDSDRQDEGKLEYSQFACQFCMEVCESKELLKIHISRNHRSRHVCDRCGKVCCSASALSNHIDTHTGVKTGITFKSTEEWLKYEDENDQHSCSLCMKVFKSEEALKAHFKRHHTSCTCDECGKVYSSSVSLRNHKTTVHQEAKPFACTICDKRCKRKTDLKIHLRTHTGERPYACEMCSKTFINISNFKRHLCLAPREESIEESRGDRPNDNDEDKQINCPFCAQVFKSKEIARLHIASSHNSHVCEKCGKVLSSSRGLREHMISHSEVKPFSCTICDKRFLRRRALACHMVVHTGERPFRCEICSKGFSKSIRLKQHKCRAMKKVSSGITPANRAERVEADQI